MKTRNDMRYLTQGAIIATLYVVLTYFTNILGLASGAIQLRIAEALFALLYFTPAAVPGLFMGCLLSNFLIGGILPDIIFGSVASLLGAVIGYRLRKNKYLMFLPNILANTLIIPAVLVYAYGIGKAWWYMLITIGVGELLSCGGLGAVLLSAMKKRNIGFWG